MKPDFSARSSQGQNDAFALLLHRMVNRIRQSLELPEILTAAVAEVRAFLRTDRVKVYRFHDDGSGEVIAEAIQDQRLPSLLGHNFPAEDIPAEAREMFCQLRQRSIVDVAAQRIGISPLREGSTNLNSNVRFRSVDPCHVDYLTAMGVRSSLVVPIFDGDRLWGLLVSHHSATRKISEQELQVVQLVADQVAVAIAQSNLLNQTRLRAAQEATINQVATLLHSMSEMQLQTALEHTVAALQGGGGRLYISLQNPYLSPQLFTCGDQPETPEGWKQENQGNQGLGVRDQEALGSPLPFERHPHWQTWLEMEEPVRQAQDVWAIHDLYQSVMPSDLVITLLAAQIRGVLIIRLQYRHHLLGYLTCFRREIEIERIWAGRVDRDDPRQLLPRQSFETWRELKQDQPHPWTTADIELAQALGYHFTVAIHQNSLYQQVCALNIDLERDIQQRKLAERKIAALNAKLEQRVLERTVELRQANEELRRQIAERERALRERQQAETSLERLSRQNELILNSAGEGIYGIDAQGKITFANPAAAKMLGCTVNDLTGQWMHSLLNHSKLDGTPYLIAESPIYTTLRNGSVQYGTEDLFYRQDGTSFPVDYVSSPIREQNKIVGAVVLFKDITARQQVEHMKDEFISIVSHELRTPLTSIRSTLGLLASGWLNSHPEKSQRMLEIAFSNTNRLVRLISDILDIERMKFGKVTMEKKRCNAADLMIQSADAMRAMAEKVGISLAVTPVTATLWADADRLIQTFTNLLNNAIKFSAPGSTIWLTAERVSEDQKGKAAEGRGQKSKGRRQKTEGEGQKAEKISLYTALMPTPYILFQVKDQGIGIPGDKLETIFDRFQQVDASNSRSRGGTGLGLTICRSIVQQHGGQIWVESHLGEGSTFYLTLPLGEEYD